MAKSKMVTKPCPQCKQQVPVACKACPCGHKFITNRRPLPCQSSHHHEGRRRTERIRKERQSYMASVSITQRAKTVKRKHRQKLKIKRLKTKAAPEDDSNSEGSKKKGRGKLAATKVEKVEPFEEPMEDLFENLSPEKEQQYSVILAEINRKICSQQFQV